MPFLKAQNFQGQKKFKIVMSPRQVFIPKIWRRGEMTLQKKLSVLGSCVNFITYDVRVCVR